MLRWVGVSGSGCVINMECSPALQYGVHAAVTMILGIRLALVALGWTLGHASAWVMCLFILCNRVVSEALCRLFPMVCAVTTMMPCYLPLRSRSMCARVCVVDDVVCVWFRCAVRGRFHRTLWTKTCTSRAANVHSPHPSSRWCTSFQSFPNRWRQCSGMCSAVRKAMAERRSLTLAVGVGGGQVWVAPKHRWAAKTTRHGRRLRWVGIIRASWGSHTSGPAGVELVARRGDRLCRAAVGHVVPVHAEGSTPETREAHGSTIA